MTESRKSIRHQLEENLIWTIITTSALICGIVFGVMQYYFSQKIDTLNDQINTLKNQVSNCQFKLSSVERRVGNQPLTLDILGLQIERTKISKLHPKFKRYKLGVEFFVDMTLSDSTKHRLVSFIEREKIIFGPNLPSNPFRDPDLIHEKNVLVWHNNNPVRIRKLPHGIDLELTPSLFAYTVTKENLLRQFEHFIRLRMRGGSERSATDPIRDRIIRRMKEEYIKIKLEATSKILKDDLVGYLTSSIIALKLALITNLSGHAILDQTERRKNVSYFRMMSYYDGIDVVTEKGQIIGSSIVVNEEYILIQVNDVILVLHAFVPSLDGRSDFFSKTHQFFEGIRVVAK